MKKTFFFIIALILIELPLIAHTMQTVEESSFAKAVRMDKSKSDKNVPNRERRCLWASINSNNNSIYPQGDSEYSKALGKILVTWRMLPGDSYETAFDLYRQTEDGTRTKVNGADGIIASTCFQDTYTDFTGDIIYELCLKGSTEIIDSYTIRKEQLQAGVPYVSVPLQKWDGTPKGFIYKVNDCSYGDLDGDGEMEIVVKRGARTEDVLGVNGGLSDEERIQVKHTVIWEAYKLDGTMLWRICSGPNIQMGNSSSFVVYDFDGDGRCEFVTRLSEGAVFGDSVVIGDTNGDGRTDYRTYTSNHIHGAPEFICVMDGTTGKEMARAEFIPTGPSSETWGDTYWKRAGSIRIGLIRCDPEVTSILVARGIYAKSVVEAWDYQNGALTRRWHFDSDDEGCGNYAGQGYHSLFVGDVDEDGLDEMCYGSMTLDHDGTPLYVSGTKNGEETVLYGATYDKDFTGYGHGDALHMGDFDPARPGLEIWSCFETGAYGAAFRDARTGETIWCVKDDSDVGRCAIADFLAESPGCEMWWFRGEVRDPQGNNVKGRDGNNQSKPSDNMSIWFTGSLNRQLLDGNKVHTVTYDGKEKRALRANFFNAKAINGTKENPCLYADLLGDWREEIIYVDSLEENLKIFSTWYPTNYRFPCMLQDHHYEMSTLNQQIGYNQPTETGFYLGSDLLTKVEFREVSGLKVNVNIFRDSLMQSKVDNGQILPGRTYYAKGMSFAGGLKTITFSFQLEFGQKVVEIAMNGTSGISIVETPQQQSDNRIYDLQGRRIYKKPHKQIIISHGKKLYK